MRITLGFILLIFQISISTAQTGTISGTIKTADGQHAEYVNIGLKNTSMGATTNKSGNYEIRKVPHGKYTLQISSIGLESKEVPVEVESGKTVIVHEIVLNESSEKLDEVIISASRAYKDNEMSSSMRLMRPILETPQNIQIVTGKVLADQQVISMSDGVLRNVSGATRVEHWGDMYTNITMRGSQIQAFRNGFNVVNSYWGPLTEDMSFVDHIEFVKGPAGFMLANGDPSGLYNVVTKKPTGVTKGEFTLTSGSYDLYRATIDLDGKLSRNGRLLYRLNVAGQNKNSFRAYEYNNRYSIAPVVSYQFDDRTKLTMEYTLQHSKMSDVGSFYVFSTEGYATLPVDFTTMPPGLAPTITNDHSLSFNFQHEINKNWKLTAQAAYYIFFQEGSDMWPAAVNTDGTMIRAVSIWDAKSEMTLAQFFVNGKIQTGQISHTILGGLDLGTKNYMADWSQNHQLDSIGAEFNTASPSYTTPVNGYPIPNRTLNLEARAVYSGGLIDQQYSGLYLQDELGFLENKIRLTLAGRYTFVKQSAWGGSPDEARHFSPRIGLSASIDKQTSVYALYDQAFTPQSGILANGKDVKPITGNNTEFGIKKDWGNGRWNTSLAIYRIMKNHELTSDPDSDPNSGLSVELGQKRSQGIEFDLRGTILPGLNLVANYAYTDSKVTKVTEGVTSISVGDVIPGFAKHTANSWLSYKIQNGVLKGTGASLGFTYLIDRATATWSKTENTKNLPDYFKLDGGIFWEKEKFKITANVFNILDKYLYSGGYYDYLPAYYWQTEAPRNLRLSLAYRF
ncbi:TonB-dependent siderophore receptor [Aquipluma nitroreducens]|uniref:TonB-dependent siderophore receptor n=1 Tax=Aquipluma nitroreducens TaxID=2010828 RepID=A0A5K7SFN0_9BACT|nr:TonB-dependent receptor [Aquipluma nitroreducens]BBE20279.1 TonB-dependent siderophore receptor [Aquipluma nitroreducens]